MQQYFLLLPYTSTLIYTHILLHISYCICLFVNCMLSTLFMPLTFCIVMCKVLKPILRRIFTTVNVKGCKMMMVVSLFETVFYGTGEIRFKTRHYGE